MKGKRGGGRGKGGGGRYLVFGGGGWCHFVLEEDEVWFGWWM
jgi:hypothetical protein